VRAPSVIQEFEHAMMQPPIRRVNQLGNIICLLIELPGDPIDMEHNLVLHTKPKQPLGNGVKPNLPDASLLYKNHVLGVCLNVYLSSPAEREEGLQRTLHSQQLPRGGGLPLLLRSEELVGPRLTRHLLVGNTQKHTSPGSLTGICGNVNAHSPRRRPNRSPKRRASSG
jgi:hypothetical protein